MEISIEGSNLERFAHENDALIARPLLHRLTHANPLLKHFRRVKYVSTKHI